MLESENNMLGVIYDYMPCLLHFVFIVWTHESTEHGSVFVIMLLRPQTELLLRSGELEILQIACLDSHILHNA